MPAVNVSVTVTVTVTRLAIHMCNSCNVLKLSSFVLCTYRQLEAADVRKARQEREAAEVRDLWV